MAAEMVDGRGATSRRTFDDMLWLAGEEIRRDWLGYLFSALYMLVFGALCAPREGQPLGSFSPEILIPVLIMLLAEPFLSPEYFSWGRDRIAERLTFQRMLPIPVNVIVGARMLAMLAALVLNVPALYGSLWLFGDWDLTRMEFVWLAIFWTGIAIGLSAYSLSMEMGTTLKRYSLTNLVVLAILFTVILSIGYGFDLWMVRGTVGLIGRFGPLMAALGLVIGVGLFLWGGQRATRLLKLRELTP